LTTSNKKDLSRVSLERLQEELSKRVSKKAEIARKAKEKSDFEAWKNREPDALIGRGYSGSNISKHVLVSVTISGNCSHTFNISLPVCQSTEIYFHNSWVGSFGRDDSFVKDVKDVVEKHITKHYNSPAEIATLCCLACNHNDNKHYDNWRENAIKRLCPFPIEELKKALEYHKHQGCHGEKSLLEETIKFKNCDTCVDKFTCFSTPHTIRAAFDD
jgi:hypothetical protein